MLLLLLLLLSLLLYASSIDWRFHARKRVAEPLRAARSLSETFPCTDFHTLLSCLFCTCSVFKSELLGVSQRLSLALIQTII